MVLTRLLIFATLALMSKLSPSCDTRCTERVSYNDKKTKKGYTRQISISFPPETRKPKHPRRRAVITRYLVLRLCCILHTAASPCTTQSDMSTDGGETGLKHHRLAKLGSSSAGRVSSHGISTPTPSPFVSPAPSSCNPRQLASRRLAGTTGGRGLQTLRRHSSKAVR